MAKRAARKNKDVPAGVTLRFANPRGAPMAKKKKTAGRKSPRKHTGHHKGKGHHPRRHRRRNPGTFMERAGKLAGGALLAVGTGVGVTYAMTKLAPMIGSPAAEYGVPLVTFGIGVAVARTMPTLGVGMALGSFAPFVIPVTGKLLSATAPSTPSATAAGIARRLRQMRAVSIGRMGAIDMGAVDMAYR